MKRQEKTIDTSPKKVYKCLKHTKRCSMAFIT